MFRFSELFEDVRGIAHGAWRFKWQGIAAMWFLFIVGWFVVMGMPNIYAANSRLFIDTQSSLRPLLKGLAVDTDTLGEAVIMARSLTSRPDLERVAAVSGLTADAANPQEIEATVERLNKELDITLDESQVLNISFDNTNPSIALSVVSQLIDMFVEGLLGANRDDSDSAQDFLVKKLKEYELVLNDAEKRLAEFKKNNIGQMPDSRGDYFSRFQKEQAVLSDLDLRLNVARQRQAEVERQLEGEDPVFGVVSPTTNRSVAGGVIGRQIAEYERELTRLSIQYTDSHPDIQRINGIIADLRAQEIQERERERSATGPGMGPLDENPVYQSMRMQMNAVDLEMVQLRSERQTQTRIVNELREKIDIIPDIEAELTRLTRDYEINKAQYDSLLLRLESARMTEAAEESKNKFDFRIIDPPRVTPAPVGPNRSVLMTLVLVLSIAAGAALMIFLSFTRPVFFSSRALERHFGVPVLGGVQLVESPELASANRKTMVLAMTSLVLMVCLYGVAVMFSQAGSELITNWSSFLGVSS